MWPFDGLPIFRPEIGGGITAPAKPLASARSLKGKSGFGFSSKSMTRLATVNPDLQSVAHRAIQRSVIDFSIVQGFRSKQEQEHLVATGASQTLNSKHLTRDAIDVAAYVNGKINWSGDHYLCIATAFVYAAADLGVPIRWGGAWHIPDIRACADKDDPGKTMLALYKATRKRQGRKVFLDLSHFELA